MPDTPTVAHIASAEVVTLAEPVTGLPPISGVVRDPNDVIVAAIFNGRG